MAITTEQVKALPGGTAIGAWRREHVARPQLCRYIAGQELKAYVAKRGGCVTWERRNQVANWPSDGGASDSWESSMAAAESSARSLFREALEELACRATREGDR
jgi:hypothetical protein